MIYVMRAAMELGLGIAWLTLLGAPLLGGMIVWISKSQNPEALRRLCWASLAMITVVILATIVGIRTWSAEINLIFWAAAYLSFSILASSTWTLTNKLIRFPLGIAAYLAFVPGYLLGTVGLLGLVFILGDYLSPPQIEEQLRPGLACEVTNWGIAISDSGYEVSLYRYWSWFPILRLKVASTVINQTSPDPNIEGATCDSVARENGYAG
jgi:hypothetical protein